MKQTSKVSTGASTAPDVVASGADARSNTQNSESVEARLTGFNGTTWDRIRTAIVASTATFTGLLNAISMGRYNATPPTFTDGHVGPVQLDVNGQTKVSMAVNTPLGNVAHDAVDSGAPIKTGGRARTTEIAAVATDDRVDAIFDKVGKQVTLPYALSENFVSGVITVAMTGTTSTSLVAAPAAGLRNYITTIVVSNAHATVGTDMIVQDGSGGATLMTIPAAAVYGGAVITLPVPLRQPTTATAIFIANVTTGASTKASAVGYTGL